VRGNATGINRLDQVCLFVIRTRVFLTVDEAIILSRSDLIISG
jgi:hypothetical protein